MPSQINLLQHEQAFYNVCSNLSFPRSFSFHTGTENLDELFSTLILVQLNQGSEVKEFNKIQQEACNLKDILASPILDG